jgi:trimeric autotransporter adhesin
MKTKLATLLIICSGIAHAQTNHFHSGRESVLISPSEFYTTKANLSVKTGSNTMLGFAALTNITSGRDNTALGNFSLASAFSQVGNENTSVGYLALIYRSQNQNTAFGNSALSLNNSGERNIAIGDSALLKNGNKFDNIGIGTKVLSENDNGTLNLVVGHYAVPGISGPYNLVIGNKSLRGLNAPLYNHTASYNTLVGNDNMQSTVNAYFNIGFGNNLMPNNQTGYSNIVFGQSLLNNCSDCQLNIVFKSGMNTDPTPTMNIAMGINAMKNTSGSSNSIGIGEESLMKNQDEYNVAFGYQALKETTTGQKNTAAGYQALASNVTGRYQTAIGYRALTASTSDGNTAMGHNAGSNLQSGTNNIFIGYNANTAANATGQTNSLAIGYEAVTDASNKYVFGNSQVTQIGALHTGYSVFSDRKLKKDIVYTQELGLAFINQLKTASFTYTADQNQNLRNGLIAQDVKEIIDQQYPDFDLVAQDQNEQKTLSIRYAKLSLPLINAVKELNQKLNTLNTQTAQIEAENKQLEAHISALRKTRQAELLGVR